MSSSVLSAKQLRKEIEAFNEHQIELDELLEFEVLKIDAKQGTMKLEVDEEIVEMRYPKDKQSIFWVTAPEWLEEEVNADIAAGSLSAFSAVLDRIATVVGQRNLMASTASAAGDLMESGASWGYASGDYEDFEVAPGRNFSMSHDDYEQLCNDVAHFEEVAGENLLTMVEDLGAVKMQLNLWEVIDEQLCTKMGIIYGAPIMVSFAYDHGSHPSITVTQNDNRECYAVKHHMKDIIAHFCSKYYNDPEYLMKQGRPPKGLGASKGKVYELNYKGGTTALEKVGDKPKPKVKVKQTATKSPNSTATTTSAATTAAAVPQKPQKKAGFFGRLLSRMGSSSSSSGSNSNNNSNNTSSPAAPSSNKDKAEADDVEQQKTSKKEEESVEALEVSPELLQRMLNLGFDALACCESLLRNGMDADKATLVLLDKPEKYKASGEELGMLKALMGMGFSKPMACTALIKSCFNQDKASTLCLERKVWSADMPRKSRLKRGKKGKGNKKKGGAKKKKLPNSNFFLALMEYLAERLGHYGNYCIACHAPHNCHNPSGAVVCCEALCVFRWEDQKMSQMVHTHLCPFSGCGERDLSTATHEFMGVPLEEMAKDYGMSPDQLLEMTMHKYLPPDQIKLLLTDGLKKTHAKSIVNCLNPPLAARFEHYWQKMREKYPDMDIKPVVGYHGTSEAAIKGIQETGFLLSKLSKGSGDYGWFGRGIYFSGNASTAVSYSRNKKLMVCSLLMGKVYECPGRMDGAEKVEGYDSHQSPCKNEWVIFDEEAILPCFILTF